METETEENIDIQEDWSTPASPIVVLQKLSEEAVRLAGEVWHNAYSPPPLLDPAPSHRRARSEVVTSFHHRRRDSSNFQKWKIGMQRALHWRNRSIRDGTQEGDSFDPEILANQKRQWYQLHSKTSDHEKYKEPTSLFEHFVIVGLHPHVNLDVVEDTFVRTKKWEQEMAKNEPLDYNKMKYRRPTFPTLEPQVLFKYPLGKNLALRLKDLAAFCFPEGVKARILEKTPSLSDLNQLVYGQEHLSRDDSSYLFSLKVADNATLYGVCLQVQEFVQRPSAMSEVLSPLSQRHSRSSRFLVSAPRCYCILTRVPFFELHYETLNSIIAQERLNRITQFVNEMCITDHLPLPTISRGGDRNSPNEENWLASAIPVDSAIAMTAAAAGIISDEEVPSTSATAGDTSDHSQTRELDKDGVKSVHPFDACCTSEVEYRSDGEDRNSGIRTFEALFSSATSMASEVEDDEIFFNHNKDPGDDMMMKWARETKNDLLQIICGYHSVSFPPREKEIIFQPLEHLQAIEYRRPPISALEVCEKHLDLLKLKDKEAAQVELKLAAAEEAVSLSIWTTSTICRVLSLESVLSVVTGVLLEKQVVVLCPNLGVLSAVVLSVIPIIRPFEWQSLFLPILPGNMLDFLDAPVPFIVGIQHKKADLKMKTSNVVRVNVAKDQVKTCNLPQLPQRKELISKLWPIHSKLSREDARHPAYKCNEEQAEAAAQFLRIMRQYLESLCSDLRSHAITSVQSNDDRVSILLKDSFVDSFPVRDQSFIKLFVETQLFTVLSDSRLSSYEDDYH